MGHMFTMTRLLCNKLRMKPHPRWGGSHTRTGGDYGCVCMAIFFFF